MFTMINVEKYITEEAYRNLENRNEILNQLVQLSQSVTDGGSLDIDPSIYPSLADYMPIVDAILFAEKIRRKEDDLARKQEACKQAAANVFKYIKHENEIVKIIRHLNEYFPACVEGRNLVSLELLIGLREIANPTATDESDFRESATRYFINHPSMKRMTDDMYIPVYVWSKVK